MIDDNVESEPTALDSGESRSELGTSGSETVALSVESGQTGHVVGEHDHGADEYSVGAHEPGIEGEELADRDGVAHHAPTSKRRRALVPMIVLGVVIVLGGGGYAIWQSNSTPEPQVTPPAVTVTAALPAPNMTPIALNVPAPLGELLPTTTGKFALSEAAASKAKNTARALESQILTYSVGATPQVALVDITLGVSRWATSSDAKDFSTSLEAAAAAGDPDAVMTSGAVEAGSEKVGTFVMRLGAERGVVTWTNGTTVLQATGPHDQIKDFYVGFPI